MSVRTGITTFQAESKTFRFKEPLMLEDEVVEGGRCLTHKGLYLSACGATWSECVCRLFGHKWKFTGHAPMNDNFGPYDTGYAVYECVRCGQYCRVSESNGKEEIYA